MLARLFVIVGGFLVIALCSLLLAPFFVNWAGYRSAFESEASRIIGQPVRVEGTAKARILPFPSVTFSNVVIDGADGIPAARIAAFSMDAELAPFLSGEILIFDMRIERPDLRVKLAENGALLWSLPKSEVLSSNTISLENVTINEGRLTIERVGGEPFLFNSINGRVSAQSLSGPWVAEGRFTQGRTTYDARFSTGAKQTGETLRARLSLSPQGGFYEASLDGQIGTNNGAPNYKGKLDFAALGNLLDASGKRQKIADINGDFVAGADGIKITDAALIAGPKDTPYRADGSASLSFGENARFDISLKGQQISFGEGEDSSKTDRVKLGVPLADRLAALENALAQIPVPDMPGQVDLALPALVIGDTIIRNAEVKALPAKTGWEIERYSVELPGRTIVEGKGDLALGGEFGFIGQMTLASKQPTGLANWLGLKGNEAIRALPGAGFSARIDVSALRQTFRDIELRAGAAVLRGLVSRQVLNGAKPRTSVQLAGENADLNIGSGLADFAAAKSSVFTTEDLDIIFASMPVSGFGFQAEKLDAKLRLGEGVLTVEELNIANVAGADIRAAGTFLGGDKPDAELDLTVSAIDPSPFIDTLNKRFPDLPWLKEFARRAGYMGTALADLKLTAMFKGSGADITEPAFNGDVEYKIDTAGLRLNGTGTSRNQTQIFTAQGDADAGETLLAGLGLPVGDIITALQLLEPVTFETSVETKAGKIQTGTLKAASVQDIFEAGFGQGAQPFSLSLADAAPYAMTAGYGLPGAAYGLPLKLKGFWEKIGTTLNLQKLDGTLVDIPVSGDVSLSQGERLKLTGNIKAQTMDRSVIDEIIFGPLSARGDDKAEFSGGVSLPFDADIVLAVENVTGLLPLDFRAASARIVANKETLRIVDATATVSAGKLIGAGEIRKNGPEAQFSFNGAVSGVDVSKIYQTGIIGKSDLQIELTAAGSTRAGLASSMIGSGVMSAKNFIVSGVSTSGFKALTEEADGLEIAPDAIATLEMATREIMSGQTVVPSFQTAFTVTSGVARAPRNQLKIEGGSLAVEPKLDFTTGEAEMAVRLQFDTGDDAVAGAEPAMNFNLKGPWNNLSLDLDTAPLQGFLGQRALEREEIRVEAIQSALLEKQRLRRENRYYAGLIEARAKAEADRLAEIKRATDEAAKAEQDKLEKERLERERRQAENAKSGNETKAPEEAPVDQPLNLEGLIKELETKPAIQP